MQTRIWKLSAVIIAMAFNLQPASAQSSQVTGYLKKEVDSGGMTKQCIYDALGSTYVKTVQSYQLCPNSERFTKPSSSSAAAAENDDYRATARQVTGYFKREITDGGLTKQCLYDALGSTYVLTLKSHQVCPVSASFRK